MTWEVLALRYGTANLCAHELALDADPHDQIGQLDYFVWLLRNGKRTVLVDTGFEPVEGQARGRKMLRHPVDALAEIGVAPEDIDDVVITHLHYDHAGNLDRFANARFHLQDREMAFATGRCMCDVGMRRPFSVESTVDAVRLVYADRIVFHEGDYTIYPGLDVHLIGGHSLGLQVVVADAAVRVVLASDAAHLARFIETSEVFPAFADKEQVLDGYRRLRELAGDQGVIVPGHDPAVLHDWPRLEGTQETVRIGPARTMGR
ncbi:N-acyl homoserine lactonase family protein [Sulfitobacter sp. W002]|uniref:N-acyl homoserine lactonase family protein n=1 Tax=Sulfitobacter sp. W002 TaxID=2867024 RepID=UPI0021A50EC8|nr:N-acyl homoserine lactonase family protein [Sulfitobacter sp. W002]UWR30943.1 N-acyl homoserine lactonase family protein [Sulfitobacter sp. W002]